MKKGIIVTKRWAAIAMATALLSGCGLTQKVADGTASMTKSIFYKQVKTLHLDIRARDGVNSNESGNALATVVRIYQLKDRKAFDAANYSTLFSVDSETIKADLLAEKDIRVRPGESVTVDMPMESGADFVAVAAMFLSPDQKNNNWRIVLTINDLDPDSPRHMELNRNVLKLLPLKDE